MTLAYRKHTFSVLNVRDQRVECPTSIYPSQKACRGWSDMFTVFSSHYCYAFCKIYTSCDFNYYIN
jgi:hypothetical protein